MDAFEQSPWLITMYGWMLATGLFWLYNIPFLLLDLTRWPALYRYKLQKEEVSTDKIIKCVRLVLFNQVFVHLPVVFLLQPVFQARGVVASAPYPSVLEIILHLVVFVIVEEILFYYSHRVLHAWNYHAIHKIHHEFRAPISIASEYAHPFEFLISSMLPLLAGPLLLGSHIFTLWIWTVIAVTSTSNHHCGYALPWLKGLLSPLYHDYHHYSFTSNFGVLGWLDRLHGTDRGFSEYSGKLKQAEKTRRQ